MALLHEHLHCKWTFLSLKRNRGAMLCPFGEQAFISISLEQAAAAATVKNKKHFNLESILWNKA